MKKLDVNDCSLAHLILIPYVATLPCQQMHALPSMNSFYEAIQKITVAWFFLRHVVYCYTWVFEHVNAVSLIKEQRKAMTVRTFLKIPINPVCKILILA